MQKSQQRMPNKAVKISYNLLINYSTFSRHRDIFPFTGLYKNHGVTFDFKCSHDIQYTIPFESIQLQYT